MWHETRCGSVCIGTGRETLQNKLCQNEARDIAVVCALEQGVRHCRISCVRMKRETLQ